MKYIQNDIKKAAERHPGFKEGLSKMADLLPHQILEYSNGLELWHCGNFYCLKFRRVWDKENNIGMVAAVFIRKDGGYTFYKKRIKGIKHYFCKVTYLEKNQEKQIRKMLDSCLKIGII